MNSSTHAAAAVDASTTLNHTPLHQLHQELGARMVPFAGYDMPVHYRDGVLKEHLWTRENAGLFDVSHMGQAMLVAADGKHETVARALEALVPADIVNLKPGRQRYTQLLNERGGIRDDLMVTRPVEDEQAGVLMLVVNAACKDADYAHIAANLPMAVKLQPMPELALIAIQGPAAHGVMEALSPAAVAMSFMDAGKAKVGAFDCHISRSGYTGEDGFEISLPQENVESLVRLLLGDERVRPIGLGARDSLRLEAGLCLYGHDIDEDTSPVEADLAWSIQKRRRTEGGFPGAHRIQSELTIGPTRKRVGIQPEGRAPAREGTVILDEGGSRVGHITSGGFGPSVGGPVAMGYVDADLAASGTALQLIVRDKHLSASVADLPFSPHRYRRG